MAYWGMSQSKSPSISHAKQTLNLYCYNCMLPLLYFSHIPFTNAESCTLRNNDVHGIDTAGLLINTIKFGADVWLDKMTAYAMLSNGELFCTWIGDDNCKREHGAVYLTKTEEYPDIDVGRMYCKDPHDFTKETMIGFYRV